MKITIIVILSERDVVDIEASYLLHQFFSEIVPLFV